MVVGTFSFDAIEEPGSKKRAGSEDEAERVLLGRAHE